MTFFFSWLIVVGFGEKIAEKAKAVAPASMFLVPLSGMTLIFVPFYVELPLHDIMQNADPYSPQTVKTMLNKLLYLL